MLTHAHVAFVSAFSFFLSRARADVHGTGADAIGTASTHVSFTKVGCLGQGVRLLGGVTGRGTELSSALELLLPLTHTLTPSLTHTHTLSLSLTHIHTVSSLG